LIVNIGGGYTVDIDNSNSLYTSFKELAREFKNKYKVVFYAEPGRAIVLSAGSVVTKIDLIRERKGEVEVFIDAGQQTKITWTPSVIEIQNRDYSELDNEIRYHFYGPLSSHVELFSYCTSMIFEEGDILKLNPMGAYTNCFASHWHGLPFAEILMVD
jgi:diaminopimelate decarboxylase